MLSIILSTEIMKFDHSITHDHNNVLFRIVFWDVLPCKIIVDKYFTWQYIPEDNSEHHTRHRENLKSHITMCCLT
jgi:hypothetical protein